ncbi:MAG: hypothetical protein DMG05_15530 [Acidobacteria bacterium]|nr:MAG: hypothetical protein DMG05_15530 [Acidobacteriota bacterium]
MNLRRWIGYLSPRWRKPSSCEACGGQFTCGATFWGCWCSETKLNPSVRTQLRADYNRCLCRACLERFAGRKHGGLKRVMPKN